MSARKWTFEVGRLLCCLLNTLDYCLTNSQDQADRILQQIRSPDLQSQVNLESIQQKLLVTRTIGMSVLLTRFENDLQPHLQQYVKIDWEQIQTPTDPSNFQLKIIEMFEETSKFPLNQVVKTLQTQTCRLFLEKLIRYITMYYVLCIVYYCLCIMYFLLCIVHFVYCVYFFSNLNSL